MDPLTSLALSVYSSKGVYGLLLGSGISRSAQIPTGWEVVLDLTRKVAAAHKEDCEPDPEAWYRAKFGHPPGYSHLLAALGQSPAERSKLLRSYFEQSEQDREDGVKLPTPAHRAIASLVQKGYVRVIVTTNFDRLLERALEEAGVVPAVIASADQATGAYPLQHSECTVVKIHGDYLDAKIRNTPEELAEYEPPLNTLLDRIFNEYGIIVCGWSAEWDTALCAAIERARSYQFGMYWAARGQLSERAKAVVAFRRGAVIQTEGADGFFASLQEKVGSLEELSTSPLSTDLLVATVKRYMADRIHRIRLHDLIKAEVERHVTAISTEEFSLSVPVPSEETIRWRFSRYEQALYPLMPAFIAGCYWGEAEHRYIWSQTLRRLASRQIKSGHSYDAWKGLLRYPALLLLYAGGIASISAEKYETLNHLFQTRVTNWDGKEGTAGTELTAYTLVPKPVVELLPNMKRKHTPLSEYLFAKLRPPLQAVIPDDSEYERLFDRFEALLALSYPIDKWGWIPPGRFAWKMKWGHMSDDHVVKVLQDEAASSKDQWAPLQAGMFGGNLQTFEAAKKNLIEFIPKLQFH